MAHVARQRRISEIAVRMIRGLCVDTWVLCVVAAYWFIASTKLTAASVLFSTVTKKVENRGIFHRA